MNLEESTEIPPGYRLYRQDWKGLTRLTVTSSLQAAKATARKYRNAGNGERYVIVSPAGDVYSGTPSTVQSVPRGETPRLEWDAVLAPESQGFVNEAK